MFVRIGARQNEQAVQSRAVTPRERSRRGRYGQLGSDVSDGQLREERPTMPGVSATSHVAARSSRQRPAPLSDILLCTYPVLGMMILMAALTGH